MSSGYRTVKRLQVSSYVASVIPVSPEAQDRGREKKARGRNKERTSERFEGEVEMKGRKMNFPPAGRAPARRSTIHRICSGHGARAPVCGAFSFD